MIKMQSKIRAIYNEIASELNLSNAEIEIMVNSMWEGTKEVMEADDLNAIYLRHLGTFYGKKTVVDKLNELRKIKYGTEQL